MSPITLRPGARALGALLVAVALAGSPSVAAADPGAEATPTASATATAEASAEASSTPDPSAEASASPESSSTATPSQTASASPTASASASPTAPAPSPSSTESADAGLVPGGDASRYGVVAAAGPATSTDPVLVGANFLEEQLRAGGHHLSVEFGGVSYPDYGLTADAVLALAAAGTGQDEATLTTQHLADHVVDYTGFGDPSEVAVGAVAKLLNVAVAQGVDPTAFGGYDLVATLQGREQPSGRFVDQSAWGDYSNTFGQSLAVLGLEKAGVGASTESAAYLALQQCPGGGFQLSESDAGCASGASADPDATAFAVQALVAAGGHGAAVTSGLDYLAGLQNPAGGVGGAGPTSAANANSTGLAGQAFLAGGRTAQARAASDFLTALQLGCDVAAELRGAVAYDQARYDAAVAAGSGATATDQDRRATAQALLALAGVPLGAVSAAGADAEAPTLACAPTDDGGSGGGSGGGSTGGSSGGPTSGSGGGSTTDPVGSGGTGVAAPTGVLAQTGTSLLTPVLVGLVLLLGGGVAVVASRRRGAHA